MSSKGETYGGTSTNDSVEKQEIVKQTQSWSYKHCSAATEIEKQVSVKW